MNELSEPRPAPSRVETRPLETGELADERPRSKSRSPGARDYKRRYGRSRSPVRHDSDRYDRQQRSRSRSKDRHSSRKNKSGFKWKEKAAGDDEDSRGGKLERGYRDPGRRERDRYRERSRDRYGDSDRDRRRDRDDGRDSYRRGRDDGPRSRRDEDRDRERDSRDFREERRNLKEGEEREKKDKIRDPEKAAKKEKREKKAAAPSNQTMIVVYINDRLGTKAGIPCLPSDPIKLFKAQVAARIGREPHEIMLKRQGERPFKDQLTLEDYGVSNGVQLDLELDTGE